MSETTGFIDFEYRGETFKTWFKVIGDIKSGTRPLVLLHGGPGIPNPYLDAHVELHTSYSIPLIFYDQVGGGKSTHLREKPAEFWTLDLFMDELDNVLKHFDVQGSFDLYGHSWGGMLAAEYAATRHPQGLHRLVLGDTPASVPLFASSTNKLLNRFPEDYVELIRRHEREGTTTSKEYQEAIQDFYKKHVCQTNPWPEELLEAFKIMEEDVTVYHVMFGSSEIDITGTLRTWSVIDKIHNITYETFIINGADDTVQDECVRPFFEGIAKVKWVTFMRSSHMPFVEERDRYFEHLCAFLTRE